MLRAKKKISKRELKEDALITTYVKARTFYETHKKNVKVAVTALAVIAVASVLYVNNQTQNNENATAQLGRVFQYYDNGQFQVAIDGVPERNIVGLKTIVENYGSTHAGELAKFYLANAYFHLGRYAEALTVFEDFDTDDPLLDGSRLCGIAGCYEAEGQYMEAAKYFEKAATKYPEAVNAAESLNHAAHNYALGGQKDKAIELYKRLTKRYPTTSFAREADRFIAQLTV